jgi:hypothetical protein
MSPQEKANELFQSFGVAIAERVDVDGFVCNTEQAKQCALIAVEEIMHVIDWHEFETPNEELNYWNKVKQEILKL